MHSKSLEKPKHLNLEWSTIKFWKLLFNRVRGNCFHYNLLIQKKVSLNKWRIRWGAHWLLKCEFYSSSFSIYLQGEEQKKIRRTQVIDDNKYIPTIMAYAEYVTPNWLANIERIRKPFYPPINCLCETRKIRHSFQIKKTKRMTELKISYFVLGRETSQMSEKTDETTSFDNVADVTLR